MLSKAKRYSRTSSKKEVQDLYQLKAKRYDFFVRVYPLIGFHGDAYRLRAIELLNLKQGDYVVELGCGTGLNFSRIINKIGPEGWLIGVDFAPEMLVVAKKQIEKRGYKNVELVQSDISEYDFPQGVSKILSTGVFCFIDDYDRLIKTISQALIPGGRIVIMDRKKPKHCPSWLLKLFVTFGQLFGLVFDYLDRYPWESIERYFQDTILEEKYGGLIYISSGTVSVNKNL